MSFYKVTSCGECGIKLPEGAEFGYGKHAAVLASKIQVICDKCYEKAMKSL